MNQTFIRLKIKFNMVNVNKLETNKVVYHIKMMSFQKKMYTALPSLFKKKQLKKQCTFSTSTTYVQTIEGIFQLFK